MMFLFAELTKEIVFVCTSFISFTLKITCEICFWYCQGNQKTEDIFINVKLTPPHHYKFFFPCIVIFIHIYFCMGKYFPHHVVVGTPVIGRYKIMCLNIRIKPYLYYCIYITFVILSYQIPISYFLFQELKFAGSLHR